MLTPLTPFRSPFSKLSSGKVMMLFMFWNWGKQRERDGDRDGQTEEASRETARQKSREREREREREKCGRLTFMS